MQAGITVEELRAGGWPLASLKDDLELSLGRSAVKELKAGGFVTKELRKAGYSVDELTKAGFKKRIAEAVDGRTLKELLGTEGALTARKGGGREGHYEAHELREAGFSAKELKGAQLDARSLKVAGYTAKEMRLAEFKLKELIGAGYSAAELKDGGFEMGLPRMGPLEFKFDKSAEISESWLEGLVRFRQGAAGPIDSRAGAAAAQARLQKPAQALLQKLHEHGLYTMGQLEACALHGKLAKDFDSVGYSESIAEFFDMARVDSRESETRWTRQVQSFFLSLAGNLSAMEKVCMNYAVAAALVLTMTFGNYSSVDNDAWVYFRRVMLTSGRCQAIAHASCNNVTLKVKNDLDWYEFYCIDPYRQLVEGRINSVKGSSQECCLEAFDCAKFDSWLFELSFVVGNGAGSMFLMLTVLYTSFLYIVLHGTKSSHDRYDELQILVNSLRQEFMQLHFLFMLGIGFSIFGITAVMCIRITTDALAKGGQVIGTLGGVCSVAILIHAVREVIHINHAIDKYRKSPQEKRADIRLAMDSMADVHSQLLASKAADDEDEGALSPTKRRLRSVVTAPIDAKRGESDRMAAGSPTKRRGHLRSLLTRAIDARRGESDLMA